MSNQMKRTIAGWLPADWDAALIKTRCNVVRGASPRPAGDPRFFDGDYLPWITVADVTGISSVYLTSTRSKLTQEGSKHTRIIPAGTLIISNSGATLGVPKITSISAGANDGIAMFLEPQGLLKEFMYFFLESKTEFFRSDLAPGVGQPNLNTDLIGGVSIPVPPMEEQARIAELLTEWNSAIEKTEQLIVLRSRQKAWLLVQVISAFGHSTKLGDFLKQASRPIPKPTEPYWALGIRSHGKGTFQRFVQDPGSVDMEELYAVNRDNLIVNITFAWEGAIALVKPEDEGCLVSHRFPTYEINCEVADPSFVKYIVNCKEFFSQLALISPGGAGRNRVLNKKDFLKLTVSLPPIIEQQRLAHILGTLDQLIQIETDQLAAIKNQKRGLMQKLLTGQWRVPVEGNEVAV